MIAAVVLAAGGGRRFDGVKQLACFQGRPLLEHALTTVAATSLKPRFVVLGANMDEIVFGVDMDGWRPVVCERWREGQAASLRSGVLKADAAGADAVVVVLGDQPLLASEAINRLIAARDPSLSSLRALYDGEAGHPVLLERALFERVAKLEGDSGARDLFGGAAHRDVACDGLGSPADADTRERLARLEAEGER